MAWERNASKQGNETQKCKKKKVKGPKKWRSDEMEEQGQVSKFAREVGG